MMRRFYALFCLMVAAVSMYGFTVDGLVYTEDRYNNGVQVNTLVDKSFSGELVIPETVTYNGVTYPVTSILFDAFKDCIGITSARIGNNVSEIGQSAFYGCTALSSVSLPESVTSIRINAFADCSKLESFTIPNSISFVGDGAFKNTAWYNNQPDGLLYKDNVLLGYKGGMPQGHLEIENGTIMIAGNAFGRCEGISLVSIPNTVKHICYQAFWNSGLSEVTIPQSVISIGDRAFADCYHLASIFSQITEPFVIKGEESGSFSMTFDYSGQTLYVPAGTKAKYQATDGWKEFQNIVEMVEQDDIAYVIGDDGKLTITGTVNGEETNIEIPDKIVIDGKEYIISIIAADAFKDNTTLESVTIPETVEVIEAGAFAGCTGLKELYALSETPISLAEASARGLVRRVDGNVPSQFDGIDFDLCVLYVPYGCGEAYRNAYGWSQFKHIEEMVPEGIRTAVVPTDGQPADVYTPAGVLVKRQATTLKGLKRGIYIVGGRKVVVE